MSNITKYIRLMKNLSHAYSIRSQVIAILIRFNVATIQQVALKRQQAAEDAIALHLASAESGTTYEYLPPGRIYGMQVTSPETEPSESVTDLHTSSDPSKEEIQVSPASIDMLSKLFPNKKRAVLELVLKRCNHDLLKAIEHFNITNSKQEQEADEPEKKTDGTSAFKPVHNVSKLAASRPAPNAHQSSFPLIASNKVFMHSLYPFLPLFNPQPVLPSPVYVPGFCDCEQCKHGLYSRLEPRTQVEYEILLCWSCNGSVEV